MRIGFSLSPGGLLLPYHLGVLASLSYHGHIQDCTPLAGSSAGAIAVASQASGVPSLVALDASIRVSGKLKNNPLFVPSGGLLPALHNELQQLLPRDAHVTLSQRDGVVALAHREVFPQNRAVLQTKFETRRSLLDAVCDSSMFPYFLTNRPVRVVRRKGRILPRAVVDGVFACDMTRIGCPDFQHCTDCDKDKAAPDRTIMVSVFPTEFLGLTSTPKENQIGPALEENLMGQAMRLVRMATQASTKTELKNLYQQGFLDAEDWVQKEDTRQRKHRLIELRTGLAG